MSLIEKLRTSLRRLRSHNADTLSGKGSPSEDPTFIRLVQLMNEDPAFRAMLLQIIELDQFNRSSVLNSIIEKQRLQGAKAEYLQVLKYLTDDIVCNRVKQIVAAAQIAK